MISAPSWAAEDPSLNFVVSGEFVKEYKLSELKAELQSHKIEFHDPQYDKEKRYRGFKLRDLLQLAYGDEWGDPQYTDIAFQALDGYVSVSSTAKLGEPGGYVVYEDLDYPNWEPVGYAQANPEPFYLLWTGKNQTTANEYPWPWSLASANLITFEDQYPAVVPKGVSTDSAAHRGYETFKGRCVRCHSMNQQGGKIGPDLNAPQSVVAYRSENMVKEFIKHPSKYRYTHMPDHTDLSEQALDELVSYFYYMNEIRDAE